MIKESRKDPAKLRTYAQLLAEKTQVAQSTFILLGGLLFIVIAIDVSFFVQTFRAVFEDPYGNISAIGYLSLFLKGLLPLGIIVPWKIAISQLYRRAHGDVWETHDVGKTRYYLLFWLIIFAGVVLSIYVLLMAGQVTFITVATNYVPASPDIQFDVASQTTASQAETANAASFVESMAPIFVVSSFSAALMWQELSRLFRLRGYNAYMETVVETCDEYLELLAEASAFESAVDHVASDRFLIESTSKAHASFHDTCLNALHRAKSLIEQCSDADSAAADNLSAMAKRRLDNGIGLPDRDKWLERAQEAEEKLQQLDFLLPKIRTSQGDESPEIDIPQPEHGVA